MRARPLVATLFSRSRIRLYCGFSFDYAGARARSVCNLRSHKPSQRLAHTHTHTHARTHTRTRTHKHAHTHAHTRTLRSLALLPLPSLLPRLSPLRSVVVSPLPRQFRVDDESPAFCWQPMGPEGQSETSDLGMFVPSHPACGCVCTYVCMCTYRTCACVPMYAYVYVCANVMQCAVMPCDVM